MNLEDIRAAVVATLENVDGLRIEPLSLENINPPCAMLRLGDFDLREVFDGGVWPEVIVTFYTTPNRDGQRLLDEYMETVPAVVDADPTLAGVVSSAVVARMQNYGLAELGDGRVFASMELVFSIYE